MFIVALFVYPQEGSATTWESKPLNNCVTHQENELHINRFDHDHRWQLNGGHIFMSHQRENWIQRMSWDYIQNIYINAYDCMTLLSQANEIQSRNHVSHHIHIYVYVYGYILLEEHSMTIVLFMTHVIKVIEAFLLCEVIICLF